MVSSNVENKITNWSFLFMLASEPQLVCGLGVMIVSLLQIKMLSTQKAWELSRFQLQRNLPWWTWQCSLFPKANYRMTDPFPIMVWGHTVHHDREGMMTKAWQELACSWVQQLGGGHWMGQWSADTRHRTKLLTWRPTRQGPCSFLPPKDSKPVVLNLHIFLTL